MLRASRAIFTFFLLICVFSCGVTASYGQSFKWNPIKHNGHEYVSLNSVKTFYGFNKMSFSGKSITLENKGVKLQLGAGSQQCRMNGVLFILSYPILSSKGRYFIARTDLVKLVDPVMRPSYINSAKVFNTVVILSLIHI